MSSSLETVAPDNVQRRKRKSPGSACGGCRRRKLRCDGQRPQCGRCSRLGTACEVEAPATARPRKSYITALRQRVATLEDRLGSPAEQNGLPVSHVASDHPREPQPQLELTDAVGLSSQVLAFGEEATELSSTQSLGLDIDEWTRAELDQLYFDRAHVMIPIIDQNAYFSRSRSMASFNDLPHQCLRHAMWTLSSLLSAQFQHLQDPLYQMTKCLLEVPSMRHGRDVIALDLVQAWVLVAIYEYMKSSYEQSWTSAGRALRLIQLLRLHEIDSLESVSHEMDPAETEERRRVFWMAYVLDHCFSMRNDWPVTFNEQMVCARLPSSGPDFQSNPSTPGMLLSDAMTEENDLSTSPFNECIIVATIFGRVRSMTKQFSTRNCQDGIGVGWLDEHRSLSGLLEKRLDSLARSHPSPQTSHDPMLLFANILGQTASIYHYTQTEVVMRLATGDELVGFIDSGKKRAISSANNIVELTDIIKKHHVSKVHPLVPMPILTCAEFLYANRSQTAFRDCLQRFLSSLGQLKNVNNVNESYLAFFDKTCTSSSSQMARIVSKS